MKKYKWWYTYGPFDDGENNLPHLGQVIRYYRELRQWKAKDLADALGQSVRHVYEIESSSNMPELISRRQALSNILKIPPILLGLAVIVSDEQSNDEKAPLVEQTGTVKVINSQTMTMYEGLLALSWELYYTASAQCAANNIDHWLQFLTNAVKGARGIQKDQLLALLCRFYQLSGVAARDRMDLPRAIQDGNAAVKVALQLENPELVSASLFRRAKTDLIPIRVQRDKSLTRYNKVRLPRWNLYHGTQIGMKQQKYETAIKDLESALPYADKSRDPLKGYVYQATAEAYSLVAQQDSQLQKKCLNLLDQVGRIVRKGNLEEDGSFVKLNIAGLYMDRARILNLFGKSDEAHNALNVARDNLGPELTRWKARLLIADAELYLGEDDPDSSCEMAFDALRVVRATQSRSNEKRVHNLYQQLQSNYPHHPLVNRLAVQLTQQS